MNLIVIALAENVRRVIPRDEEPARPVTVRRAVLQQAGMFHGSFVRLEGGFGVATLDLASLRDTSFAYVIKVEVDHKSKSALAGGNSVNSCNNVVNNRKNCALRIERRLSFLLV